MTDKFGKRNRREEASKLERVRTKPARMNVRKQAASASPSGRSRFYIVIGAAILILIVGGYVLAA
jgi:hypothetical protein